jgi:hypothetical protein
MSWRSGRWLIAAACLVLLSGCEGSIKLRDLFHPSSESLASGLSDQGSARDPEVTG